MQNAERQNDHEETQKEKNETNFDSEREREKEAQKMTRQITTDTELLQSIAKQPKKTNIRTKLVQNDHELGNDYKKL